MVCLPVPPLPHASNYFISSCCTAKNFDPRHPLSRVLFRLSVCTPDSQTLPEGEIPVSRIVFNLTMGLAFLVTWLPRSENSVLTFSGLDGWLNSRGSACAGLKGSELIMQLHLTSQRRILIL